MNRRTEYLKHRPPQTLELIEDDIMHRDQILSELLKLCEQIAREAHGGQVRRDGRLYILHPMRVSEMVHGDREKCVAWLHDTIEDCGLDVKDLMARGVPFEIASDVGRLTTKEDLSYEEYLWIIKQRPSTLHVKLADIVDNLSDSPTPEQKIKYFKALKILCGAD